MENGSPAIATRQAPADAGRRSPTWLAAAVVSITGARSNPLDRHVVAVLGYLQADRARYLSADSILRRWPWPATVPTRKGLDGCLRRLASRSVLVRQGDAYRVDRDLQRAAADVGARFRYEASDFDGRLSGAAVELLALLRGREQGRRSRWADSIGCLAEVLGSTRSATSRAMAELRSAGRVETIGEHRLRSGHRLPVLAVRATRVASGPYAENACDVARNACDAARNACDAICTPSGSVPTKSDHPATTPPLALLTWSPDQSRACGADDPVAPQFVAEKPAVPPPPPARPTPPRWTAVAAAEAAGARALADRDSFEQALRTAVARWHLAPSSVDDLHDTLASVGVFAAARRMTEAGRRGLRRHRVALAERLASQRVVPSQLLEAVHRIGQLRPGLTPREVVASLLTTLRKKTRADFARRMPMAAGVDALDRLVQPQRRSVGDMAYPAEWWRAAVPQPVLDSIADIRATVAGAVATCAAAATGDQLAVERIRRIVADRGDQERAMRLAAQLDAHSSADRRNVGRLIGAAQAGDWRRLAGWLAPGMTAADVARLAGIDAETVAAGLANVHRRATA